jgi:hypothetical protein
MRFPATSLNCHRDIPDCMATGTIHESRWLIQDKVKLVYGKGLYFTTHLQTFKVQVLRFYRVDRIPVVPLRPRHPQHRLSQIILIIMSLWRLTSQILLDTNWFVPSRGR